MCDDHFHEKVGKLGDDEKTAETIDAMCDTAVRSTYMRLVLLKPLSKLMPRKGDVCEDVLVPRGGLSLHAQGCRRGPLGRTQLQSPWVPLVEHLDLSLVPNVKFRVAGPSACARLAATLLPAPLEVGPWVCSLPFVAINLGPASPAPFFLKTVAPYVHNVAGVVASAGSAN